MVKSRTSKDLRRRPPFKKPNKAELIICEGSSTETTYFKKLISRLQLRAVRVDVIYVPDETQPITLVNHAIERKNNGKECGLPYSKIWCVIDVEMPPHETLDKACEKISNIKTLSLILTNPFFEYWFLLHFKKVSEPFNGKRELFDALKKVHQDYKKTRIGFDKLYPHTGTAIKNSKDVIKEKGYGNDLRQCNPSTHVHKLVEHLKNLRSS